MDFKAKSRLTRKNIIMFMFSCCLSLIGVLTICFYKSSLSKNVMQGLNVRVFTFFHLLMLILGVIVFYKLLLLADRLVRKNSIYRPNISERDHNIFGKVFLINMASWGIWFWVYFPGTGMNDTINCIMSYHNDNQTLIYQLLIYYGIQVFTKITNNMTIAYAILVIAQMVLMAMTIAFLVSWLDNKGIKRIYIILVVAYYAFMPAVADYSITLVKDTLYGVCMVAVIPLLYELVVQGGTPIINKKFYCGLLISLLGVNLLRSNGKYIVFIVLFVLMIIKLNYKKTILSLVIIFLLINTCLGIFEKKIITSDVAFRESIGVPLAQIGAVLVTDGYISETDRESLNNLLPLDIWREGYAYSFADTIKFNGSFNNQWLNENKGKFIDIWYSILIDNLGIYIKAYLCHTYGFWNISPMNITSIDFSQSYFRRVNNNTGDDSFWGEFCISNNLRNHSIENGTVREQLDTILKRGFQINLVLGAGIVLWLCVWCMVELIIYKKYMVCFAFLPILLNWMTLMIAAPASFIYRYSFYLILSVPILFIIVMIQVNDDITNQNSRSVEDIVG